MIRQSSGPPSSPFLQCSTVGRRRTSAYDDVPSRVDIASLPWLPGAGAESLFTHGALDTPSIPLLPSSSLPPTTIPSLSPVTTPAPAQPPPPPPPPPSQPTQPRKSSRPSTPSKKHQESQQYLAEGKHRKRDRKIILMRRKQRKEEREEEERRDEEERKERERQRCNRLMWGRKWG